MFFSDCSTSCACRCIVSKTRLKPEFGCSGPPPRLESESSRRMQHEQLERPPVDSHELGRLALRPAINRVRLFKDCLVLLAIKHSGLKANAVVRKSKPKAPLVGQFYLPTTQCPTIVGDHQA